MAALTFADYKSYVQHAATGAPNAVYTDADTTKGQIVNEAGRQMVNGHPWSWRKRPVASLAHVADQAYIALPSDLGEIISIKPSSTLSSSVQMVSFDYLQHLRAYIASSPQVAYAAVVHPTQASATVHSVPRLEIHPTGQSGVTWSMVYRAGWATLTTGTDVPNIPLEFESLLVRFVRAVTADYEKDSMVEMENLYRSSMYRSMVEKDSRTQSAYGEIRNGMVQSVSGMVYPGFDRVLAPVNP